MDANLRRDLRLLKTYAVASTLAFAVIALSAAQRQRPRFEEIDVERINLIEKDGTVRLVIANPARLPHPTFYGKEYRSTRSGTAQRGAGMVYFNEEGTEMGGFVWSGRAESGGGHRAHGLLTFDQYNQNEALSLSYSDAGGRRSAGLMVADNPETSLQPVAEEMAAVERLPDGPEKDRRRQVLAENARREGIGGTTRLFAGRDRDGTAALVLADPRGKPRLRLSVDSTGSPRLQFLDEAGTVIQQLPAP